MLRLQQLITTAVKPMRSVHVCRTTTANGSGSTAADGMQRHSSPKSFEELYAASSQGDDSAPGTPITTTVLTTSPTDEVCLDYHKDAS